MERDELATWLRLSLTPGIGNAAARRLLAAFGLPQRIFQQGDAGLRQVVTAQQLEALRTPAENLEAQLQQTIDWLGAEPVRRIVTLGDDAYPPALLNIEDPPLLLYLMGRAGPGDSDTAIAVVGSRNPTPQGRENARRFGQALAEAGLTVVSGLALGIDGAAHEGALAGAREGQLATIAVVGTGLDRVYPSQHLQLARRIAERGLLISEQPLGTPPLPANFPRRNRLIAALSLGTLVVEAALQSGSLITARLAAEQGKEVFAVPGSIHATQSRGCHALLRQGAKLVESAQDVLEELRPGTVSAATLQVGAAPGPAQDGAVLRALGFDPVGLDALIDRTGLPASQLQARLLELELAGQVARLPGGLFQRVGTA